MRLGSTGYLFFPALVALWAVPAAAQITEEPFLQSEIPFDFDRGRNVSVVDRERPEYQALGIQTGGFTLFPRLQAGVGYSDNVFGSDVNKREDVFFTLDPQITASSNWSRHALSATASANIRRYAEEDLKNTEGWNLGVDGRYELVGSSYLAAGARIRRSSEELYSGAFPEDAVGTVDYDQMGGYIRANYQVSRVRLLASADVNKFDFSDVAGIAGEIDQDNRDRTVYRTSGRAEYALTPDASIFVQGAYSRSEYRTDLLPGVANRDSDEVRVIGGASFDLTALIRGSVGAGYVKRSYDSPLYNAIDGVSADIRLEYFITELTTISLNGRRYIEDSTFANSGGYFNTGAGIRIDHELLRNLLLNAAVDYENDDFKRIDRDDNIYRVQGGARYLMNRSIGLGTTVAYTSRKSSGVDATRDFDEVRALISLLLQI
jgi:hypothetical protein